jgi:hypothetical protein
MMRRICSMHRFALAAGAGLLCQVGPCGLTTESSEELERLAGQLGDLVTREVAIVISDTAFFILDNLLVRLAG